MIQIQNIYYMLAYAFQVLNEKSYESCSVEKFENTADLMSAILVKGLSKQIKRGLNRDYLEIEDSLSAPRGRMNITQSIKQQTMIKQELICIYDEFSVNSYMNRIIKTTVLLLLKQDIASTRKKELRNLMMYFSEVEILDWRAINWDIHYNRNNQTYQMLVNICWLVIKGLIQTESSGKVKMSRFLDEQRMHRLYEKFILEYYRKEYKGYLSSNASHIAWQLDAGSDWLLPGMKTDIMLSKGNEILIIDAKYYQHSLQTQFDVKTIHSGNMYQIFTYVKNKEAELKAKDHKVSGMLLYAKTDEEEYPDNSYMLSGNQIEVRTLDLNLPFPEIAEQLNNIVDKYFRNNTSLA